MMTLARASRLTKRGLAAHKAGRIADALMLYRAVIEAQPHFPDALHHAALAARQLCAHAKTRGLEPPYDASSRLMLTSVAAATAIAQRAELQDRAAFWSPSGQFAAARRLYAAMLCNYGWFQHDQGRITGEDGARVLYEQSLAFDEDLGETWTNLGHVYAELGLTMRAEAAWCRALELPATSPEATYNLAFLKLMRGDYEAGWREYEARWQSPVFLASYGRPDLTAPRWNGERVDGILYLHGEQGAGDVLMMLRYVPLCAERCASIVLEVNAPLVPLMRLWFPGLTVVAQGDEAPPHAAHLPTFSLPAVFGTTLANVPENPPIPAELASIPTESGRIGLCWRGSAAHQNDRNRSMPFEEMRPLFEIPGLTFQSLQYGAAVEPPLEPLAAGDYLETARAIARCELVISVDTSVAHLAAVMGVPTWILLPHHAEWRWLRGRRDTPWYPSVTLWRQPSPSNWHDLIVLVEDALRRACVRDE